MGQNINHKKYNSGTYNSGDFKCCNKKTIIRQIIVNRKNNETIIVRPNNSQTIIRTIKYYYNKYTVTSH